MHAHTFTFVCIVVRPLYCVKITRRSGLRFSGGGMVYPCHSGRSPCVHGTGVINKGIGRVSLLHRTIGGLAVRRGGNVEKEKPGEGGGGNKQGAYNNF